MKRVKHHPWLKTMLVALCGVLSCFALAVGVGLPVSRGVAADGDVTEPAAETYELTQVDLNIRDGYVFTSDLSDSQMYDLVEVAVTYTQVLEEDSTETPKTETYKLNLTGSGNTRTDSESGEIVQFTKSGNAITAKVTPKDGYDPAATLEDGTLAVSYGTAVRNGIAAIFTVPNGSDGNPISITTLTPINTIQSGISVYYAYNNGTVGNTNQDLVNNSDYSLLGSLFPNTSDSMPDVDATYVAKLTVSLNDGVESAITMRTAVVDVTVNTFVAPYSIVSRLSGSVTQSQVARSELDLGTLSVTVLYANTFPRPDTELTVPLNSFDPSWYTVTYYDADYNDLHTETLTTAAKYVAVNFEYKGTLTAVEGNTSNKNAQSGAQEIIVSKLALERPTFPTNTASVLKAYATDVNVDVVYPDYKALFPDRTPKPLLSVDNGGHYTEPTTGNVHNITFDTPGTYHITVVLDESNTNNADFEWANSGGGVVSGNTITYTVQIDKGQFDISLSGDFEWTYGETVDDNYIVNTLKAVVTGKLKNSANTTTFTFNLNDAPADKDSDPDKFGYELEFYNLKEEKLGIIPTQAGKYKVKAVTYENAYYESATTNDFTVVTINPKTINKDAVVKSLTYDGNTHEAKDFLNSGDFISSDLVNSQAPITVTNYSGTAFSNIIYYNTSDTKGYRVYLTIDNDNYIWGTTVPDDYWTAEDKASYRKVDAYFLINKLVIKYSVTQNDFYYGAPSDISANVAESLKQYLIDPNIKYTGGSLAAAGTNDRSKIDAWDAGDYTVSYTPVYKGGNNAEEKSLNLVAASCDFTIKKALLHKIALADTSQTYNGETGVNFSFQYWYGANGIVSGCGGWGKYKDVNGEGVLIRTVTPARTDVTAPTMNYGEDFAKLIYADTYSVKVEIADKTNFAWWGDTQEDITCAWTVNKKNIYKPSMPASVTYNHDAQEIVLNYFDTETTKITAITGSAVDGSAISNGFTAIGTDGDDSGRLEFTYAGDYTVTVALKDDKNYKWTNESGENESAPFALDYTVNRATAALFKVQDEIDFSDAVTQYFAVPTAKSAATGNIEMALSDLGFVFTVSGEGVTGINNTNAASTTIIKSGTYTYEITDITGVEANNYVMPVDGLIFTFNVKSQNLVIPTFRTGDKELAYNGAEQSILQFITNYTAQNYGDRIVITIKAGTNEESKGSDPKVKDVYYDNGVKAYTVYVAPAPNYKWVEGEGYATDEAFTFEFTVTQLEVEIDWGTLTATYGDADIKVEPAVTNKANDADAVGIVIGYSTADGAAFSSATPAGNYTVTAIRLDGAAKNNYKCSTTNKNYTATFTIKKQKVAKPTQSGAVTASFEGAPVATNIQNLSSLFTAQISGYRPAEWFGKTGVENNLPFELSDAYGLNFDNGVFTFVNAGHYTVTFTLKDTADYCWDGDNLETNFTTASTPFEMGKFAKVSRKSVQAPSFNTAGDENNYRAQEWGDKFDKSKINVTSPVDGMTVNVTYGSTTYPDRETSATVPWTSKPTQDDIGQYYILIKLESSESVDILNYVWNDSTDELPTWVEDPDKITYKDGEVSVLLRYAITGAQLPLTFNEITYVFGDNGVLDGADSLDLFTALKNSLTDRATSLLTQAGIDFNATNIQLNAVTYAEGTDIENDLPWNVGNYDLSLSIKFVNHSVYQDLPVKASISVTARPIEVKWDNLSKTYDGESDLGTAEVATATLINLPKRNKDATEAIKSPVLIVSAIEGEAKNVGTYHIKVDGFAADSDNASNLNYEGAKNYDSSGTLLEGQETVEFTVSPRAVTIEGVSKTNHVYGETLPDNAIGNYWKYPDGAAETAKFVDSTDNLVVKLVKDGNEITRDDAARPDVGTYTVNISWANADAEYAKNYTVNFDAVNAAFTVIPRAIDIDLGNVDKTYFDDVDYTSAYADNITCTNGTGDAIVDALPFTLKAKNGASEITKSTAVGNYTIYITKTNDNYAITVTGIANALVKDTETETAAKYNIAEAILDPTVTITVASTYNNALHEYLATYSVANGTNANHADNELKWFIGVVATAGASSGSVTDWQQYTAGSPLGQTNAGTYYFFVKVTAKNHEALIVSNNGAPFVLEITDATLNVTVNGYTTVYDAKDHGYLKDNAVSGENVNADGNAPTWYIAVVDKNDAETATAPAEDSAAWKPYNASEHKGHDADDYYFFVKVTALNHADKVVTAADGKPFCLKINQAEIFVGLQLEIFYYEANPADMSYMMSVSDLVNINNAGKFIIADNAFKSEADKNAFYADTLLTADSSFTYTVPRYAKGNDAGRYKIELNVDGLKSTNYKFTNASNNELNVKQLPVTVTIDPYTATYNQARDTLTPLAAKVNCTQAGTYGGVIDITDIAVTNIVTSITTEALKDGDITTNNVKYADAEHNEYAGYDIEIGTSGNFAVAYTTAKYTIKRATNAITTEDYHLFVTADLASTANSPTAWTYGDKVDVDNPNGYDKDGAHKLQTLALVSRDNDLRITIARGGSMIAQRTAVGSADATDATTFLNGAFAAIYESAASFAAGDYEVSFVMDRNIGEGKLDNFEAFNETWKFTVAKKEVTVTPSSLKVVYGEAISTAVKASDATLAGGYVYDCSPLAGYNGKVDELNDVISFVFDSFDRTDNSKRTYVPGWNADAYDIKVVVNGTFADYDDTKDVETDNYVFCFGLAALTVTKREVSIEINPAHNHYMFIGAYNNDPNDPKYADEDAWLLDSSYGGNKYSVKSGTFYNDVVPFEIKTQALNYGSGAVTGTKDHGRYAIYAEFIDETFQGNYSLTVVNTAYDDGVIVPTLTDLMITRDGELRGGIFTVEKAQLYMSVSGPYYEEDGKYKPYETVAAGGTYDGKAKHYQAEAAVGNKEGYMTDLPKFVPEYYQGSTQLDGAPVDKGSYYVRFVVAEGSGNDNFEQTPTQSVSITIDPRPLNLSSGLHVVDYKYTYKGSSYNVDFTLSNIVAADELKIEVAINGTKKSYTLASGNTNRNHTEAFENVITGGYTVEIALSADMTNYTLPDNTVTADKEYTAGGKYTCKLDIEKMVLYVWIKNATVQYGTTIFDEYGKLVTKDARFSGFNVAYSTTSSEVNETAEDLLAIINDNKAAGYFVDTVDGIMFNATNTDLGGRYTATHASGSVFAITMPNLSATNFDVTNRRQGSLTVTKRSINVTVSGAESGNEYAKRVYNGIDNSGSDHFDYLNKNLNAHLGSFLTASENAFGASGDDLSSFNVKLTLSASASNVKNVGSYNLTVSYDNSNYNIRFLGSPTYEITPATLKVKVQAAGTAFTEGEVRLGVIYGSDVSGYGVSYSGFVNGESSTELSGITTEYSFKYGDKSYEAYKSRVGEVYGASVRFGSASNGYQPLVNYTIAYDDTTKLDISPLKISVAVEESNIYREAEDGYNYGVYGASMEAGVTLAGYDSAKSGAEFAPKFTRTYNTSDASHNGVKYQEAGKAPRRVGKYTVTVALETNGVGMNNYDYCFDDGVYSVTRDYEIKQQSISLAWKEPTIHSDATDKSNSIANYRKSIMTILTFTCDTAQPDIADCVLSDDEPGLTYDKASATGRYTITVLLNELARNNYCWEAPIDADKTRTSAYFTITGQGVVVIGDQSILGWEYGEYGAANAPSATLYPHGSNIPIADATLLYYFALVTGSNTDGVTMTGNVLDRFNSNDYDYIGAFTLGVPTNAGVYVMRVDFDGNAAYQRATSVYYIFRVDKKGIDKPTVEASVYNEAGGEVDVSRSVVGFDSSAMRIVGFDGVQTSYSGTSLTVSTVNANAAGYNIRVELSDPNYYWNGDADATVIDVKWVVTPATDNAVAWDATHPGREYEYGAPYTIAAKATYSVNGTITYSYTARGKDETAAPSSATWTSGLPVNAGKYWIKATSSSNNGNYNEKFITTAFKITKATLHVQPSGSAQYGDLKDDESVFSFSRYDFVDTDSFGFKRDDTAEAVRNTINRNGVTYAVAGTGSGAWAVDDYDLTVTATHLNYDVVCVTGTFTVTKRTLVVSIGRNGASYYSHAIDYSNVTITIVSNLVDENDRASIIAAIRAALDAGLDETSDAGTYPLGVKSSLVLDNYTVSATPGTYTIDRLPVRVIANWGGYAFGSAAVLPSISEVYDNTTKLTLTADELALFTFVYGSSTTAPTAAGSHPVSVHVASNSNYILANSVSGLFVITLTELDAELIEWETVYFDTVCAKPQVTGIKNDAFSASMFEIEYIGDWNRAGVPYVIRLTLKSPESTKWKTVEGVTRDLTYTIAQGKNALVENISINGWVYGEYSVDNNLPTAKAKFGTVVFEYSDAMDGVYTTAAPANGNVGTYWVRAVVEGTTDYERFVSPEPVHFEIAKKTISAPELNIITDGYGQNNVYIGSAMQADVIGYDSTLMYIRYDDGAMIVNGNSIKVIATNAGSYRVTVTLVHSNNYAWAAGAELDGDGNAVLTWTIARRKLTKPTDNDATLIVNGQELKYFPIGFDDATMGITGNTSGYGGTFTATVSIKDTDNYEWADGTTDDITFEWNVVGADTVFVVVISILSSLAGVAAIGAGVQLYFYLKKRKEEKAN